MIGKKKILLRDKDIDYIEVWGQNDSFDVWFYKKDIRGINIVMKDGTDYVYRSGR